jgi:hypothetical protein
MKLWPLSNVGISSTLLKTNWWILKLTWSLQQHSVIKNQMSLKRLWIVRCFTTTKCIKEKWNNLDSHYKNLSNNYKGICHHTLYKEFTIDECDKFTIYFGNSTRNIMKQFEAFEGELFHSCPCTLKIYTQKGMVILFQMCKKLTMQKRNMI